MTVAAELVAALEASSLPPVFGPGSTPGELPAVFVTPADSTVGAGALFVEHAYTVTAAVPRSDAATQLERLEALTDELVEVLSATAFTLEPRIRYTSTTDDGVPWIGRELTVSSPGRRWC